MGATNPRGTFRTLVRLGDLIGLKMPHIAPPANQFFNHVNIINWHVDIVFYSGRCVKRP
jgi:hypothetical protein